MLAAEALFRRVNFHGRTSGRVVGIPLRYNWLMWRLGDCTPGGGSRGYWLIKPLYPLRVIGNHCTRRNE